MKNYQTEVDKLTKELADRNVELGKALYELTKNFLDQPEANQQSRLLANQVNSRRSQSKLQAHYSKARLRGRILSHYFDVWSKFQCEADIKDTNYAQQYQGYVFGKYSTNYPSHRPMTAGFNLEAADLSMIKNHDIVFLSVNFKKADFADSELPYSHFEDCNLKYTRVSNANFNQCLFRNSVLFGINISKASLCEVSFIGCDLRSARLPPNLHNLHFYTHSICDYATQGLNDDVSKKSILAAYPDLHNVNNNQVMTYWSQRYNDGTKLPKLFQRVIDNTI